MVRARPILVDLLEKARRRVLSQLVLDKGALALAITMGGAVLLLIAGTQILDWYWLVILAVAGFGTGLYQLRNHVPSLYRVAQIIDRRLGLADSLSTAVYFSANPEPNRTAVCDLQQRLAEESAHGVDLVSALPFRRSRYLLPAGVLAVAALVLFAVRYGITGSIDLRPSLVALAIDTFFPGKTEVAKNQFKRGAVRDEPFDAGNPDQAAKPEDSIPDSQFQSDDPSDTGFSADSAKENPDASKSDKGPDGADPNQQGDKQSDSDQQQDGKDSSSKQDNAKQGNKDGKGGKESNMFDKMRDALANMLNKMKSSEGQKGNENSQQNQQGESQNGDQQQAKNSNSQQSSSASQQGQGDKDQGDASGEQASNKNPPEEASSGKGNKDGDKAAKEAKMLEAMGKISELFGKRSQNLSGEMMIEVGSSKQQLKTPFMQQQANHTEAGSEIHRDEVPLMYQQFVEQYFEEVRKVPGAAKAPAKAAPKAPGKAG